MKVCIYMEGKSFIKIGGVRTAYYNKIRACKYAGLEITTSPKDEFDLLQVEFPGPKSLHYMKKARKIGRKVLISTHITAEDFKETFIFGRKMFPVVKAYLKFLYSQADALISPSEYTKELMKSYGLKKPIYVLSNGIDPDFLRKAKIKGDISEDITVGCVGFVTKRKGIETFAKIAQRFPDLNFVWVGEVRKSLLFDISKFEKIPNLKFTGYVEDISKEYEKFDIFLFPSYEENQGIVLLEAGAYGLPLIVRDIPAYRGWLVHEENCLKCRNDDEFEENLERLLKDDNLRRKLKTKSRELAENNSLDIIGEKIKKIYEKFV